jgi:hypothetical protein
VIGWALFRGGPNDGHVLPARPSSDGKHLVHIGGVSWADRITDGQAVTNQGKVPVAEYVGQTP